MIYIKNLSTKILAGLIGFLLLYYLMTHAFPKFIISEEIYGHHWPTVNWLFPHIVFATIAILLGPFQFISFFRKRYLKLHRITGKIYIICAILSSICGMVISISKPEFSAGAAGIFFLGFVWLVTTIMSFLSIKKGKVELHKEWMIRSYTVAFSFVALRFSLDILVYLNIAISHEIFTTLGWSSWVLPLFFAEILMQGRKLDNVHSY